MRLAKTPPLTEDALRAAPSLGSAALEMLDACRTSGSRRRAADLLHVHHSSVARRLEQIGGALTDLPEPAGLVRARLTLTVRRLPNS